MNKGTLHGQALFLANMLTQNYSSFRWTQKLLTRSQARLEEGLITEEEQTELLRDTMIASKVSGLKDPKKVENIDWKALLDYLKEISLPPEDIIAIARTELRQSQEYYQKTLGAKRLRYVIEPREYDRIVELLSSEEFDETFREYKLDQILGLIDWNHIHRGPIRVSERSAKLKSMLRAKTGVHIARVWQDTLQLRYPDGFPGDLDF